MNGDQPIELEAGGPTAVPFAVDTADRECDGEAVRLFRRQLTRADRVFRGGVQGAR